MNYMAFFFVFSTFQHYLIHVIQFNFHQLCLNITAAFNMLPIKTKLPALPVPWLGYSVVYRWERHWHGQTATPHSYKGANVATMAMKCQNIMYD